MSIAIALDGPAGAGKSSIAKRAAAALDFIYVDTGALYRAIGLAASRRGVEPVASKEVDDMLAAISVDLAFNDKGEQIVLLNGEDVSAQIRTPEASMMASKISAIPDAQVKIFLTASPEARAVRRYKELIEKGMDVRYEDILQDVITRDYNDSHRETAPLKPAEGCVMVDTTELDFEQSVQTIISVIKENSNGTE